MAIEQEQFLGLLGAAMLDAAETLHLSQFQTSITPEGAIVGKVVRLIIAPDFIDSIARSRGSIRLGDVSSFLMRLVEAMEEVAQKKVLRQVVAKLEPPSCRVRVTVVPEEMDFHMNPHIDPRIGD